MKNKIGILVGILMLILLGAGGFYFWKDQKVVEKNQTVEYNEANSAHKNEVSLQEKTDESEVLVVYFSRSGNTETVANFIRESISGSTLKRIETVEAYPEDYNELLTYAQRQKEEQVRPEIKNLEGIENFDVIFIGYPIWWGSCPMAIFSFLEQYDMEGKILIPFCTSGGSGIGETEEEIQSVVSKATVLKGLAIYGNDVKENSTKEEIQNWLDELELENRIKNMDSKDIPEVEEQAKIEEGQKIKLIFEGEERIVQLEDNEAVRDFLTMLPLEATFEDYAKTEKISYLSRKLNTSNTEKGFTPQKGDFAYYIPWGNIIIYYEGAGYSDSIVKLGTFESKFDQIENQDNFKLKIEKIN